MRNKVLFNSKMKLLRRLCVFLTGFFILMLVQGIELVQNRSNNVFTIYVNGTEVGWVTEPEEPEILYREARKEFARQSEGLSFTDTKWSVESREQLTGERIPEEKIIDNIVAVMKENRLQTEEKAYTVKINEYTVNLKSADQVVTLLTEAKNKYDDKSEYSVELLQDPTRELSVLTAQIRQNEEAQKEQQIEESPMVKAGVERSLYLLTEKAGKGAEISLGLKSLEFGDTVEVVEAYLPENEITSLEDAVSDVTREQEKEKIYEVQPGDTLSEIAEINETTMEELVALNENIENENSMIRSGDELIVTIPEPELSMIRTEEEYYEDNYNAPVQYVDNDEWYTTDTKTLQDPIAGFHKVVADVTYRNDRKYSEEIVQEEIVVEAVPRIVERGTKIPPTYIKPISGGRMSSGFGKRTAPKKGASTYHRGIDWATPVGTAVMASCSGRVSRAGWGSGYGYVIYIDHADGRQTRYGHLSKILVKAGQTVNQGDKIALSGNTGRSTGPHIHFELLIGGSQVNPLKYLN